MNPFDKARRDLWTIVTLNTLQGLFDWFAIMVALNGGSNGSALTWMAAHVILSFVVSKAIRFAIRPQNLVREVIEMLALLIIIAAALVDGVQRYGTMAFTMPAPTWIPWVLWLPMLINLLPLGFKLYSLAFGFLLWLTKTLSGWTIDGVLASISNQQKAAGK